jgi:esterase/lipase
MKCYPYVLTTSSIEKQGLDEVKGVIAMAAGIDERGVLLTGRAKKIRQMQEELKTQELKAKLEEAKKLREQKIKKTKKKLQQSVAKNVKAPFSVVVGLDDDDE